MKTKLMTLIGIIVIFPIWMSCQKSSPVVVTPSLSTPVLTSDLIKKDPASIIEGIYTGDIYSNGIEMPDGQILIKRLDNRQVNIFSVYGLMVPYVTDLIVNKDTIRGVPNKLYNLSATVKDDKPVAFSIWRSLVIPYSNGPELAYFTWSKEVTFKPLSTYRSNASIQPSLNFLTGIYNGQYPARRISYEKPELVRKAIVIKQISATEIELSDVNRFEIPIRFSVQKSETDSTWKGENNSMYIAFTISKGQPERFTIESKTLTDTTVSPISWPYIHYEYNSRKITQGHSFIPL